MSSIRFRLLSSLYRLFWTFRIELDGKCKVFVSRLIQIVLQGKSLLIGTNYLLGNLPIFFLVHLFSLEDNVGEKRDLENNR